MVWCRRGGVSGDRRNSSRRQHFTDRVRARCAAGGIDNGWGLDRSARRLSAAILGWITVLLVGVAGALSSLPGAQAQSFDFTLDFESGDLRGWVAQGSAFRNQPTLGDNPTARGRGQPSGHQGDWWIGTFENFQGQRDQRRGGIQGDAPTGTLTSAGFILPTGFLTFLVGGGAAFETRVELLVQGEGGDPEFNQRRVYHASGENTESMNPVRWNVSPYAGKRAFLRIVDAASGNWGHINVDHFRFISPERSVQPIDGQILAPVLVTPQAPPPTRVPSLIGMTLQQARAALETSALALGQINTEVPNYRQGNIIRQDPQPRTPVPSGSAVDVVLGGPPRVVVPPLIDKTLSVALRTLEAAGLRAGDVDERTASASGPGTVIDQQPPPGTQVRVGRTVALTVAIAPEIRRVRVPNLHGLTPREAASSLLSGQLALGEVSRQESLARENTVIDQSPAAGQAVPTGSAVGVVIADTPIVWVPDLVDKMQDQAEAELMSEGLKPGEVVKRTSIQQAGTVLAQAPGARSRARIGSTVDIVVAIPEIPTITPVVVPNAIGLSLPGARQRFADAELATGPLIERPSDRPSGSVLRHKPMPGARVQPGTAVTLWVAVPKPMDPRWLGLPAAALAGVGGTYLLRRRLRTTRKLQTLKSGFEVTPHADPGSVTLQSDHAEDLVMDIRLRAISDPGNQALDGEADLIEKEDREP